MLLIMSAGAPLLVIMRLLLPLPPPMPPPAPKPTDDTDLKELGPEVVVDDADDSEEVLLLLLALLEVFELLSKMLFESTCWPRSRLLACSGLPLVAPPTPLPPPMEKFAADEPYEEAELIEGLVFVTNGLTMAGNC